jgi:hypothetical protein
MRLQDALGAHPVDHGAVGRPSPGNRNRVPAGSAQPVADIVRIHPGRDRPARQRLFDAG